MCSLAYSQSERRVVRAAGWSFRAPLVANEVMDAPVASYFLFLLLVLGALLSVARRVCI